MLTLDKNNEWFQLSYSNEIDRLKTLKLEATIRNYENKVFIYLSHGDDPFALQFTKGIPVEYLNEEALVRLADSFVSALSELYPVLEERSIYIQNTGQDLPDEALASLYVLRNNYASNGFEPHEEGYVSYAHSPNGYGQLWKMVIGKEHVCKGQPFTAMQMFAMQMMYQGAAISRSPKTILEAFMTRPTSLPERVRDCVDNYQLTDGSSWTLDIAISLHGLFCWLCYNGEDQSSDFQVAWCSNRSGGIQFEGPYMDRNVFVLTWEDMEAMFGITDQLYYANHNVFGDPMEALQVCYQQTEDIRKLMPVAEPIDPASVVRDTAVEAAKMGLAGDLDSVEIFCPEITFWL